MNDTTQLTALTHQAARPAKWRWRHKKLYHDLYITGWSLLGALPGLGSLWVLSAFHIQTKLEPAHALGLILAAGVFAFTGLLLGSLLGCAMLLVDKFCCPENSEPKPQ